MSSAPAPEAPAPVDPLATPSEPPAPSAPAGDVVTLDLLTRSLPRKSLFAFLLYWWMYRFTASGRMLVVTTTLVGMAAAAFTFSTYPMYFLASFFLSVMVVDAVLGWVFKPRVVVRRRMPDRVAADAEVRVRVQVENVGWLPAYDVSVLERASPYPFRLDANLEYTDVIGRGETRELSYVFRPTRRGAYDLPGPEVVSAFPFGLYNSARRTDHPHRLLVYPRFKPLSTLEVPAGRRHQPGGLELVSSVGDSEEFVGLRDYRTGDRLRDIHYIAWARVGHPVVREYNQEYLTRVAMAVDTFMPRRSLAGTRQVEAVISLGAAVADALAREEYVIDIFAAGPELYHFQAGRSLAFLDDILDVLACVEECRTDPFPELGPALLDEIGQISTVVVVLLDWDEPRRRFVHEIESRGSLALVFVVRDGQPTLDPAGMAKVVTPAQVEEGIESL